MFLIYVNEMGLIKYGEGLKPKGAAGGEQKSKMVRVEPPGDMIVYEE